MITDLLSGIIPGYPVAQTLYNRTGEFVNAVMKQPIKSLKGAIRVFRYDNISINYKPSRSRSGAAYAATAKIATAMDVNYRGNHNNGQPDYEPLQTMRTHSPLNDSKEPRSQTPWVINTY
jgi:hypothetical protein